MKASLKEKSMEEAIGLLRRWNAVTIPSEVWTDPGEDYDLPIDTQAFLQKLEKNNE